MASCSRKTRLLLGLGLLTGAFVGCPVCTIDVDPDALSTDGGDGGGGGAVDWSSYDGLHIYAHKWVTWPDEPTKPDDYVSFGPVDLLEFENAVYSECYETIGVTRADEYMHICDDVNVDGVWSDETGEYCPYALCVQQVSLCAGYRNLELADTVGAVEFTSRPLVVALGGFYDRGTLVVIHEYDPQPAGADAGQMVFAQNGLRYKVPPQSPGDRTLLYEAAMEFFREAGIRSGEAIENGCLKPDAPGAWSGSAVPFGTDVAPSGAGSVTPRTLGLAGFEEAVLRFNDAVERLVRNEQEVSSMGGALDAAAQQAAFWNGGVNSRLSANQRLYGEFDGATTTGALATALTPLDEAARHAVTLLRAAGIDVFYELPEGVQPTGDKLASWVVTSLRTDHGQSTAGEDIARFLANNGLSGADFAAGARYLRDEATALRRPAAPTTLTPDGVPRSFAYSAPPSNPMPSEQRLDHSSSFTRTGDDWSLDEAYARQGAAQTMQYFKGVASFAVDSALGADVDAMAQTVRHVASALAGEMTVRFRWTGCLDGACTLGVVVTDIPGDAASARLVAGPVGLHCVTTGWLGDKRCGPDTGSVLARSDRTTVPGRAPLTTVPAFVLEPSDAIEAGTDVYVLVARGRSQPEVIASDTAPVASGTGGATIREQPAGGSAYDDDVAEARDRAPDNVARAAFSCGDLPESYVPPLENELTEDSDLYENSWRHYLDAADRLASEADALGQEMLDRGLQMDMMAEEAEGRLRDICGDTGPVPEGGLDGAEAADVRACYDVETTSVSLGGPACTYIVDGFQCLCPSDSYDVEPPGIPTICDVPCPLPAPADVDAAADCEDYIRHWHMDPGASRRDPVDGPDTLPASFEYVDPEHSLGVFEGPDDAESTPVDCASVYNFRCMVEAARHKLYTGSVRAEPYTGCRPEDGQPYEDAFGSTMSAWKRVLDDAWASLRGQSWLSLSKFQPLVRGLTFAASQFHNFTVYGRGQELWGTQRHDTSEQCLPAAPFRWLERSLGTPYTPPADPPEHNACFDKARNVLEVPGWWIREYYYDPYTTPYYAYRVRWGQEMFRAVWDAQFLGGFWSDPRLTRHHALGDLPGDSGPAADFERYPNILMHSYVGESCESGFCPCAVKPSTTGWLEPETRALAWARELAIDAWTDAGRGGVRGAVGMCDDRWSESEGLLRYLDAPRERPQEVWWSAEDTYLRMWANLPTLLLGETLADGSGEEIPGWERARELYPLALPGHTVCKWQVLFDPASWLDRDGTFGCSDNMGEWFQRSVDGVMDALELACYVREHGFGCDSFDPAHLPSVTAPDDVDDVARYIECAAKRITDGAASIVLPEFPSEIVTAFRRAGMETYFPGIQGRKLEAYLAIESALSTFASEASQVPFLLYQVATRLKLYKQEVKSQELQGRMYELQVTISNIQAGIAAASSAIGGIAAAAAGGGAGGLIQGLGAVASFAAIQGLQDQLEDLARQATTTGIEATTSRMMIDVAGLLDQLRQVSESVANSLRNMQSGLGALKALRRQAELAAARASFEISDSADVTYRINEAMRNWLATDRARYETLVEQAKEMAFVARRAIEFRLGVDVRDMRDEMFLVPSPASWADDICRMRGMDYDSLSGRERIRGPSDDGDAGSTGADGAGSADAVGTADWDMWNGRFVGGYVGDYVRMLRLFVESYPMDFPFADGTDTVVLSLKDDLREGVTANCDRESYNLMYRTEDVGIGRSDGGGGWNWLDRGPEAPEPRCCPNEVGSASVCMTRVDGMPPDDDPRLARTTGFVVPSSPSGMFCAAGDEPAVSQAVSWLVPGRRYALTWWLANQQADGSGRVDYRVEVRPGDGSAPFVAAGYDASVLTRVGFAFVLPSTTSSVEVRVYPSGAPAGGGPMSAGTLRIGGFQLEEYAQPPSVFGTEVAGAALAYEAIEGNRFLRDAPCADVEGWVFRSGFSRRCFCDGSPHGICTSGDLAAGRGTCAWEIPFEMTLGGIEDGSVLPDAPISPHNFNYRLESLGINVVGTNVRRCEAGSSPETCWASAYLPYTLTQSGSVSVRNHADQTEAFGMPEGRIEHAKALAAEVVLTNPPTTSQQALMQDYIKDELRGRPLNGDYVLRIWQTPELDWSAVEDIQILLRYRYWTRQRYGD